MTDTSFSAQMNDWLQDKKPKTFGDLEHVFKEKSFAVAFLLLMATAALPIPTGGITHIFEIITMLLALELTVGRSSIWLPKWWRNKNLGQAIEGKALPKFVKIIRWFEGKSQPRFTGVLKQYWVLRAIGIVVLVFSVAAFVAPPFSGLDTLPALGIVLVSLSMLLEDALLLIVALAVGTAGIIVELSIGSAVLHFF